MKPQTKSSQQIAEKIKAGDKRVFKNFYRHHLPKLTAYVATRVGDHQDVEEIVQDSFLSFLDALPLFRGQASLWSFLVSISKHEIADYYRKKYAKRALEYVPFIDKGYTPDLYTARETREKFSQTLAKLMPEQRQLIEWKYERNWSVQKIAAKLDISVKAAESRLFRARKAFQLVYIDN